MRLLVVEDYAPLARAVAQGLRESGHAVDVTADGEEALWYAQSNPYDLIVLDLMIPGIDGLTVLRRLRDGGSDVAVLILTAKDAVADRVAGLDAGADDYLVKPFAFEELLARVRALVRRNYGVRRETVEVADLVIDTIARTVTRGGEAVELSAREYAVLEYLARRRDQFVTRAELWEHVYDFAAERGSNVLDVYLSRLRKKIDGDRERPLLRTQRGRGIMLGSDP